MTERELVASCASASRLPAALTVPKKYRTVEQQRLVEFWKRNGAVIQKKFLTVAQRRAAGI